MSDEFRRLASALEETTPSPSPKARRDAIAAAVGEFDQQRQGIPDEERHTGQKAGRNRSWPWRLHMPIPPRVYIPVAAVAVVVAAVFVGRHVLLHDFQELHRAESVDAGWLLNQMIDQQAANELSAEAAPSAGAPAPASSEAALSRVDSEPSLPPTAPSLSTDRNLAVESSLASPESTRPPEGVYRGQRFISDRDARALRSARLSTRNELLEQRLPDVREQGGDRFIDFDESPVKAVAEDPVSTFSIDVDTSSYSIVRASLNRGALPPKDAVRVEELINYFPYDYPSPAGREQPFATHVSVTPTPWNELTRLLHIGIKGYVLDRGAAPRANLVFLIDTSGSMDHPDKLPLLVNSFKQLLGSLSGQDTVAIVSYAGTAGTVLPPTKASERAKILASLERLRAGGSTAGAEGLRLAYLLAEEHRIEDGVNRVILATDGDFNVGFTDWNALEGFVERKREAGVFLSVLGFGWGNYNDALMQRLAQNGNGNAAYIDSLSEARKVLVDEATAMLFPIAKDVKIQVEFNPDAISEYRLIGYEIRNLAREDFANDKVDAGDVGAGHTVTAIYEITPKGSGAERIAPLRYQSQGQGTASEFGDELAYLKVRYKLPESGTSQLITRPVTAADASASLEGASDDVRFASAVAAFGQLLRGGRYTGGFGYDDVISLAIGAKGTDGYGYRSEFVGLVRLADSAAPIGATTAPVSAGR